MSEQLTRRCRPLLGTYVEISVAAPTESAVRQGWVNEAFAAIAEVQRLMSFHDPDSELSRLNDQAHVRPQAVHPGLRAVLDTACALGRESDGLFDIAVGAELQRRGFLPARSQVGLGGSFRDIELHDNGQVSFRRPLSLDLGGIAKGFAVDCALETLSRHGPAYACVNAGGDLRVCGDAPVQVAIRNPRQPRGPARLIPMTHPAVATSSACFSPVRENRRPASAILHPGGLNPAAGGRSVSVFAHTCLLADALTKVAWLAPTAVAHRLLAQHGAALYEWDNTPA